MIPEGSKYKRIVVDEKSCRLDPRNWQIEYVPTAIVDSRNPFVSVEELQNLEHQSKDEDGEDDCLECGEWNRCECFDGI